MTEEEKKEKLAELRQRLAQKRAAAGKEDEKANKANEALRRKAGQDTGKVKADMEVKEAQKEADRKKRGQFGAVRVWGRALIGCREVGGPKSESSDQGANRGKSSFNISAARPCLLPWILQR